MEHTILWHMQFRFRWRERPWASQDSKNSFCLPTFCLQPNCALDMWREEAEAREVAIKIKHLDTNTDTLNDTHL